MKEKLGLGLGLQVSGWLLGGEPGTLGFTVKSQGVEGLSVKHQGRRAPLDNPRDATT